MRIDGNSGNAETYEPNSAGLFSGAAGFQRAATVWWTVPPTIGTTAKIPIISASLVRCMNYSATPSISVYLPVSPVNWQQAAEETQARQIALFKQVHPEYGAGVGSRDRKTEK